MKSKKDIYDNIIGKIKEDLPSGFAVVSSSYRNEYTINYHAFELVNVEMQDDYFTIKSESSHDSEYEYSNPDEFDPDNIILEITRRLAIESAKLALKYKEETNEQEYIWHKYGRIFVSLVILSVLSFWFLYALSIGPFKPVNADEVLKQQLIESQKHIDDAEERLTNILESLRKR